MRAASYINSQSSLMQAATPSQTPSSNVRIYSSRNFVTINIVLQRKEDDFLEIMF